MLVIIAGTRHFIDPKLLDKTIEESGFHITCVISGAARGVDLLGERWAQKRGIGVRSFPAKWDAFGKAAGVMRNEDMAKVAQALIALPCQHSKGTKDMIERAESHGLHTYVKEVTCKVEKRQK